MTATTAPLRLAIVGDYLNEEDEQKGAPFSGYGGRFLRPMLRSLGVDPRAILWTNVFNLRPANGLTTFATDDKNARIESLPQLKVANQSVWVHRRWQGELDRLDSELRAFAPNCILALGSTPLWALFGQCNLKKYRGTTVVGKSDFKILPTYAPLSVIRQWKLRPIVYADLQKTLREATFPELRRPSRIIYIEPTLEDLDWFYEKYVVPAPSLSCDIETKKIGPYNTITEIGFAPDPSRAMVVPFWQRRAPHNYWPTKQKEIAAWRWVAKTLAHCPQFGQNFNYDITYLWREMGIPVPRLAGDTMLLQHSMYPEMEKGLGFLASLHTTEPSWKFMRSDHDSYKDGDD